MYYHVFVYDTFTVCHDLSFFTDAVVPCGSTSAHTCATELLDVEPLCLCEVLIEVPFGTSDKETMALEADCPAICMADDNVPWHIMVYSADTRDSKVHDM